MSIAQVNATSQVSYTKNLILNTCTIVMSSALWTAPNKSDTRNVCNFVVVFVTPIILISVSWKLKIKVEHGSVLQIVIAIDDKSWGGC